MKKLLGIILIFTLSISCKNEKKVKVEESTKLPFQEIKKEDYELYKPTKKINAVLVLFGGYPEVAEDIKREFKILEIAKKKM